MVVRLFVVLFWRFGAGLIPSLLAEAIRGYGDPPLYMRDEGSSRAGLLFVRWTHFESFEFPALFSRPVASSEVQRTPGVAFGSACGCRQ